MVSWGLLSSVVIHIHTIQGIKISYIHHNVTLSKSVKVNMLKFQQLGTFKFDIGVFGIGTKLMGQSYILFDGIL